MDLSPDLVVFHQPVRLRIMGLVYRHRDVSFTRVRDLLALTDGNLASHANKLAESGHIEARRVLESHGFELRYRITRHGSEAFRQYLGHLRHFLDEVGAAEPGEVPSAPKAGTARARADVPLEKG